MNWLNANSGAVQAITGVFIAFVTAVLVVATLVYVRLTNQIARASVEQGEAQQKPCLILRSTRREDARAILDPPLAAVVEGGTLRVINIGNGPALNVECDFRRTVNDREVSTKILIPHLNRGDGWDTPLATGLLDNIDSFLDIRYDSLSGTRYRTRFELRNRVIRLLSFGKA